MLTLTASSVACTLSVPSATTHALITQTLLVCRLEIQILKTQSICRCYPYSQVCTHGSGRHAGSIVSYSQHPLPQLWAFEIFGCCYTMQCMIPFCKSYRVRHFCRVCVREIDQVTTRQKQLRKKNVGVRDDCSLLRLEMWIWIIVCLAFFWNICHHDLSWRERYLHRHSYCTRHLSGN